MVEQTTQSQVVGPTEKVEFAKFQIGQALETFRSQLSLLLQIETLLALANVTVAGYAISAQISGVLFIGAIFPILVIIVANLAFRLMTPIIYSAVSLEYKYGGDNSDWVATTFLAYISSEYTDKLKIISNLENSDERMKQLREKIRPFGTGRGRGLFWLMLGVISIGQIIAPIILTTYFKWRLF